MAFWVPYSKSSQAISCWKSMVGDWSSVIEDVGIDIIKGGAGDEPWHAETIRKIGTTKTRVFSSTVETIGECGRESSPLLLVSSKESAGG